MKPGEFFAAQFFFFMAEDFRIERLLELEQVPEDASQFVSHGGDGLGSAQSGFPAAVEIPEIVLSAPEALGSQAEGFGDAGFDIACGGAQNLAAANAVIRTEAQPGSEAFSRIEFMGEVRTQFCEQDQDGGGLETGDGGQVHAQDAVRFGTQIELGFIALGGTMRGFGRRQRLGGQIDAGIQGGQMLLELVIAGGDLPLIMLPGLKTLAQGKEMLGSPVALEAAGDGVSGSLDAMIFEGGQLERIALARQDGLEDGQSGDARQITDDMLKLNVHLGEGLVHEADLIGGTTDEAAAMTKEGADDANDIRGTKAGIEQPHRVKILEPLAVLDVGLAPGEMLAMTSVDQTDLHTGRIEDLEERNPIDAGGFHGDGPDATGFEPIAQLQECIGKGIKGADGFGISVGWNGDPDFASADVNAGGVRVESRETTRGSRDFFLGLFVARGHNMPLVNSERRADGPQRRNSKWSNLLSGMHRDDNKRHGLTSDLHGGCGTKLTHGLVTGAPLAGRCTCRRPPNLE